MSLTRLSRRRGFQCLHRYQVNDWPAARNQTESGACFTPEGHGHNYELEAYFEGAVDPESGMIVNLADVDSLLAKVLFPLEGKRLDSEIPEFKDTVPTTEILASYVTQNLLKTMHATLPGIRLVKVRLYEYDDLWVDVWP